MKKGGRTPSPGGFRNTANGPENFDSEESEYSNYLWLGAALARQSGQDEDEAVRHLWGKLAILLQRGNAAILGNRVPDFPAPAINGRY